MDCCLIRRILALYGTRENLVFRRVFMLRLERRDGDA